MAENDKIELTLSLAEVKEKVNKMLEDDIRRYLDREGVNKFLSEGIADIFKTPLSDPRKSRLRQTIDDAIENHIRSVIYDALNKTDIKESINNAIEDILRDGEFIKELAKVKTREIVAGRTD